jgi:ATP-dependent Clp protease ATP-binding subunit ClpA
MPQISSSPLWRAAELRTIAATTWSEYKKFFEKDAALARRFQVVKVEEPTEEQCMVMLRGIVSSLEKHHNVRILDEAVRSATALASLSRRPPAAGQSRQRDGHRLRPSFTRSKRHASYD